MDQVTHDTQTLRNPLEGVPHDVAFPPRSVLLARAFDLGIEKHYTMSNEELVLAIRRAEEALARSLALQ